MKSSFIVATMDSALLHQFMVFLLFLCWYCRCRWCSYWNCIHCTFPTHIYCDYHIRTWNRVATAREIQIVFNRCIPLLKTHKYYARDTTSNKIHICSHMSGGQKKKWKRLVCLAGFLLVSIWCFHVLYIQTHVINFGTCVCRMAWGFRCPSSFGGSLFSRSRVFSGLKKIMRKPNSSEMKDVLCHRYSTQ